MKKIRVISYFVAGWDKDGNDICVYYNDTIEDVEVKLLIKEEDINIYIKEIKDDELIIDADGKNISLKKGHVTEFDCWTYDACFDGTSNHYFFKLSLNEEDILNYEQTKHSNNETFIKLRERRVWKE